MFQLSSVPVVSDLVVIFFSSTALLTPNGIFLFVPLLHSVSDIISVCCRPSCDYSALYFPILSYACPLMSYWMYFLKSSLTQPPNGWQTLRYAACSAGTWLIYKLEKIKGKCFKLLVKSSIASCSGFIWAPNMSSSQNGPWHTGEKLMGSNSSQGTPQQKREIFWLLFQILTAHI
jgi:hypothetical protein